jgi:ribosomal protein L15
MREIVVRIPEDIAKEIENLEKIDVSSVVNRFLIEKISELIRIKKILEKSELTEEKAKELAEEVNEALYKRYKKLYEENFK